MKKFMLGLLLIPLLLAAAPAVKVPATIDVKSGTFVPIRANTESKSVTYVALDEGVTLFPSDMLRDARSTVVMITKPGRKTYRILAYGSVNNEQTEPAIIKLVVDGGNPEPTPDPDLPPSPQPVTPTKVQLMVVIESVNIGKLTREQQAMIYSQEFRDYLSSVTHPAPKDWRIVDPDDKQLEEETFKTLLSKRTVDVPCVIMDVAGTLKQTALPETLSDLKQWVTDNAKK